MFLPDYGTPVPARCRRPARLPGFGRL